MRAQLAPLEQLFHIYQGNIICVVMGRGLQRQIAEYLRSVGEETQPPRPDAPEEDNWRVALYNGVPVVDALAHQPATYCSAVVYDPTFARTMVYKA